MFVKLLVSLTLFFVLLAPGAISKEVHPKPPTSIVHKVHKPTKPVLKLGQHYTVSSTCYDQGTITASGQHVFIGEVANNFLSLGTKIYLDRPVWGRRTYVVEDRIGAYSQLDFYNSSYATCIAYGRETVGFRVILPTSK